MNDLEIQVQIAISASEMTADKAVEYVKNVVAGLSKADGTGAPIVMSAPVFGLDKQLGRLLDHNPAFATRVRTLHDQLILLGYAPHLPKSKKDPLPSYISYIDPVDGANFGNLNSEKFYVMRGELKTELAALPHFGSDSRYANVHLVSDDAVQALLKIAEREKK
jgi:hypothetical protein